MRYFGLLISVILLSALSANTAHAACTSPAGVKAEILYNSSQHVPQYCDGSQWIAMGPVGAGPGGGCTSPTAVAGTIIYNKDYNVPQFCAGKWVAMGPMPGAGGGGCTSPSGAPGAFIFGDSAGYMQYCDGTNWIALRGYHSAAGNTCDLPNTFDFTDDAAAPINTAAYPSNIVQITGTFTCNVNVSVASGTGNPQYRICNDGTCSGAPAWSTATQTITSGQWVQVSLDTPNMHNVARTAYLTVGQTTANWIATTLGCDTTPNTFTFTDATNQPLSQSDTRSDIIQISGIDTVATGCGAAASL